MEIVRAKEQQYDEVRGFYHAMIDAMKERGQTITWIKDVYPAPAFIRESLAGGELYLAYAQPGSIAAAMVLNHRYNDEYRLVKWKEDLPDDQILVIHALGVHPDYNGKGVGRAMVAEAIRIAGQKGVKAVRLDVLASTVSARTIYVQSGFKYRDTLQLYYENTGWAGFEMYELIL